MADPLSTTGKALDGASKFASVIPGIGTGISLLGTTLGSIFQGLGAKRQAQAAEEAQRRALATKTEPIRPEFLKKLRMDKMLALGQMPGLQQAQEALGQQTAEQLRAIQESSPGGSVAVGAISAALGERAKQQQQLSGQNEAYRVGQLQNVSQDLAMLGEKGMELENRRDVWKKMGLESAAALRAAADANKMTAANTIIGGITSTGAALSKNALNQQYMNMLANAYADKGAGGAGKTDATTQAGITTQPEVNYPDATKYYSFDETETSPMDQYNQLLMKATAGTATEDELKQLRSLRDLMRQQSTSE